MPPLRPMLRLADSLKLTGKSKSALYRDIADGLAPKPVPIGGRSVAWPADEIAALNAARIAGKTPDEIRELVKQLEAARKVAA